MCFFLSLYCLITQFFSPQHSQHSQHTVQPQSLFHGFIYIPCLAPVKMAPTTQKTLVPFHMVSIQILSSILCMGDGYHQYIRACPALGEIQSVLWRMFRTEDGYHQYCAGLPSELLRYPSTVLMVSIQSTENSPKHLMFGIFPKY